MILSNIICEGAELQISGSHTALLDPKLNVYIQSLQRLHAILSGINTVITLALQVIIHAKLDI